MVGLIQIVIIMGCGYLVLKVFHIFQTGLAAAPENRRQAMTFALIAMVIGFGTAAICFWLMLQQSASIGSYDTPGF
ncbi:hypothetical protein D3C80_818130 [compost metagenome]